MEGDVEFYGREVQITGRRGRTAFGEGFKDFRLQFSSFAFINVLERDGREQRV